ncbi:hypothetical protein SELMODRAFT_429324 [Selaginella moellendorffii]|uniref:Fucosyltransferase n=1 Tax=Selaginella moellendorffii TaxID=88036 RepID=D8T5T3_SELML|nr:hypothetical protein SELMODRAFT_429324 [Selaginella moellendorffii]
MKGNLQCPKDSLKWLLFWILSLNLVVLISFRMNWRSINSSTSAASSRVKLLVDLWSSDLQSRVSGATPPEVTINAPHIQDCKRCSEETAEFDRRKEGFYQKEELDMNPETGISTVPWVISGDDDNLPLTRRVQRDIWLHQHPKNCTDARFLLALWHHDETRDSVGVGSDMVSMAGMLGATLIQGRVFITKDYHGARHKGCTVFGESNATNCGGKRQAHDKLPTNHRRWWRAQASFSFIKWHFAISHDFQNDIEPLGKKLQNWCLKPLALNGRIQEMRGDKASEMRVVSFDEYMKLANVLRKKCPHVRNVWLSTEMQNVVDESKEYKGWKFYYSDVPRQVGTIRMVELGMSSEWGMVSCASRVLAGLSLRSCHKAAAFAATVSEDSRILYCSAPAQGHNQEGHPESNARVPVILRELDRAQLTPKCGKEISWLTNFMPASK